MQALANMNEQDENGNGWPGIAAAILMAICALCYFLTFFLDTCFRKGQLTARLL